MAVSATDTPVRITVSKDGGPGIAGTDGIDGVGFNQVRKMLIDSPLTYLYKKNGIVSILNQLLTVDRNATGAYTDIYGDAQTAAIDTPREESTGWLITSNETHTFNVKNNIPLLSAGFSCVFKVGGYTSGAVSQDILTIPSTSGDLFVIGTDSSDNWLASLRGSDLTTYTSSTTVAAAASTVVITYDGTDLKLYVDDVLSGSVTVTPLDTDTIDVDGVATIAGNFSINIDGLRFYDFVLNSYEITYLSN